MLLRAVPDMTNFPLDPLEKVAITPADPRDMALASKYARQGPRYTSYPTAMQFRDDFARDEYLSAQHSDSARSISPLSLYVHLPFCRDICYYCACNKIVTREKAVARNYLRHLKTEIEMQSELIGTNRPVTQMHWGGGTPTYLDNAEITELMHMLASHFRLLDKGYREYSIEIDPRTVHHDTVALLKGLGFNRISLGIQDFDPLVQKAVNRIQPVSQIEALVECIRSHGYRSLSFDLIYGLPHQDRFTMDETLRRVIALRPDRIASYSYAHLPERFRSQRAIDRLSLPPPEEKLLLQQLIGHRLQEAGYLHIGMDHYVLPNDDLALAQQEGRLQRNFQGYSLRMAEDLLGLGASAISQIGDFYVQNERELDKYYARLDRGEHPVVRGCHLSQADKIRRYIIMNLICELRLDIEECDRLFGISFTSKFSDQLQQLRQMEADGLVDMDAEGVRVTPRGRSFLRNICMLFDDFLEMPPSGQLKTGYSDTL